MRRRADVRARRLAVAWSAMTGEPATVRRAGAPGSWLPDVLGAALAVAFLPLVTHHLAPQPGERALDALGYGLLALAGGALVLCRRRPAWPPVW